MPVKIAQGALGQGLPTAPLRVSPQHRMLIRSVIAERMFGSEEVLVAAKKLTALPGITVEQTCRSISYFHLILDRHEILFANNAPTESLFLGPEAIASLEPGARAELAALFPELLNVPDGSHAARIIPKGSAQKRLVFRHNKNDKPLLVR